MLAGEYLALHGLETFAFPIKYGQKLTLWQSAKEGALLKWKSKNYEGKTWFTCEIETKNVLEKVTDNATVSGRICELIQLAKQLNPRFELNGTYMIETQLEFDQSFGLGSSSTLVSLIAQWARVDVMQLQHKVFGGSGYDAAVCSIQKPLVYWKNEMGTANWALWEMNDEMSSDWLLCFPRKKVNSRSSLDQVKENLQKVVNDSVMMTQLDTILQQVKVADTTEALELSLEIWQAFISKCLGLSTAYTDLGIKKVNGGLCKYLGAWGGDIILVNKKLFAENKTYI